MIKVSIPSEDVIIHAISHKIRREILKVLIKEPKTFSDLLNYFDLSTGKLNYHLNQIKGFTKKNDENKYQITPLGLKTLEILEIIHKEISENEQPYLKEAFISQKYDKKSFLHIRLIGGISFGIGGIGLILFVTVFLTILFFTIPGPPIIVWPILAVMLFGESMALIWLIRMRKSSPAFIERINKILKEND